VPLAVVALAGVLSFLFPVPEPDPEDCVKVDEYSNLIPGKWHGLVVCGVEEMDPPTTEEVREITACLDSEGYEYDVARLVEYRYYFADDMIAYPTQWINKTQFRVSVGWTDWFDHEIYVRKHMRVPGYEPRMILKHELVHALTETGHKAGEDPFDQIECLDIYR
jgi:hypothetical protein